MAEFFTLCKMCIVCCIAFTKTNTSDCLNVFNLIHSGERKKMGMDAREIFHPLEAQWKESDDIVHRNAAAIRVYLLNNTNADPIQKSHLKLVPETMLICLWTGFAARVPFQANLFLAAVLWCPIPHNRVGWVESGGGREV